MTEKRFTDIEHDYENARIKCKDDGYFMIYSIYDDDDGLQSIGDLLNGLDGTVKDLSDDYEQLLKENRQLKQENKKNEELLHLITNAYSVTKEESVKEILRDEIRGIDTVTDIYSSAWNDYCILSKFFKERYGEDWDDED